MPRTNAAMISRCTCGFCEVIQSVMSPVPGCAEARHARGSIAFGINRWLRKLCFTTFAADANAASVALASPIDHLKQTLPGASSWTTGEPRSNASAPSGTAGRTS